MSTRTAIIVVLFVCGAVAGDVWMANVRRAPQSIVGTRKLIVLYGSNGKPNRIIGEVLPGEQDTPSIPCVDPIAGYTQHPPVTDTSGRTIGWSSYSVDTYCGVERARVETLKP